MECRHHRDAEGAGEIKDVCAILAAPDASAILDAHNFYAAIVEGVGRSCVVGLSVAPDPVADLGGVGPCLTDRMKGYDLPLADGCGQVVGERGDPALSGRVSGNESGPRDQLAPSVGPTVLWPFGRDAADKLICPFGAGRRCVLGVPRPEAMNARAANVSGGLGCADLNGARALGAGLDFERDALAAGEAIEIERGDEAATMEEVFLPILGSDKAEPTVGNDLLDGPGGHN